MIASCVLGMMVCSQGDVLFVFRSRDSFNFTKISDNISETLLNYLLNGANLCSTLTVTSHV